MPLDVPAQRKERTFTFHFSNLSRQGIWFWASRWEVPMRLLTLLGYYWRYACERSADERNDSDSPRIDARGWTPGRLDFALRFIHQSGITAIVSTPRPG